MGHSDVLLDAPLEAELLERFSRAIREHGRDPIEIRLDAATLFTAVGLLQLALRHPALLADPEHAGFKIVERWATVLAGIDPTFGEVVKRGWRS